MKIVVCVKQVPDTTEIKINPQTGTLIREGVPSILNPDDASALEAALEIKDREKDAHITVITMGPPLFCKYPYVLVFFKVSHVSSLLR
jgi:electron transfer flavoprotein alpha/beta subunit